MDSSKVIERLSEVREVVSNAIRVFSVPSPDLDEANILLSRASDMCLTLKDEVSDGLS